MKESPTGVCQAQGGYLLQTSFDSAASIVKDLVYFESLGPAFSWHCRFLQQAFFTYPKYFSVTLEVMYFLINVQQEKEPLGISLPSKGTEVHSVRLSVDHMPTLPSLWSEGAKMLISPFYSTCPPTPSTCLDLHPSQHVQNHMDFIKWQSGGAGKEQRRNGYQGTIRPQGTTSNLLIEIF